MENANRSRKIWRTIKRQLKFIGMGCCGSTWHFRASDISNREDEEAQAQVQAQDSYTLFLDGGDLTDQGPSLGRMSLAMALEFDRHFLKVGARRHHRPLMRLFEETDGQDHSSVNWYNDSGTDGLCCVCMERNKDAAFISCGHTYCRPCSTELWLNRGSCPLCNRSIEDILYIY
ncbi:hypothetical protein M9H77_07680 [Catharanthus roseus]|uniref:Uncharacterized protein n=1 Tax=Catharanthus roseus TaxID=4058 RepID=A0ACC0BVL7_CATRO|nr:hypothetical protein M9H77_07680 [Catharanthus roseus]